MSFGFNFWIQLYKGGLNNSMFKWDIQGSRKTEINVEVIYSNFNDF